MKLYESAYTYIPFAYLFIISTLFATLFHHAGSWRHYRPFTLLTFTLINTFVQFFFKTQSLVKSIIHKHVWKTVTLSVYGVLFNSTHEMIFEKFHFSQTHINYTVSTLYAFSVLFCAYYLKKDSFVVYCHIIALYFPIARVWQINMYIYVIYVACCIFIMFSKCSQESIINGDIYRNPVIKFFMYLRLNDAFMVLGIIQLYIEYYSLYIPEINAISEIEIMINEQQEKLQTNNKKSFDDGL